MSAPSEVNFTAEERGCLARFYAKHWEEFRAAMIEELRELHAEILAGTPAVDDAQPPNWELFDAARFLHQVWFQCQFEYQATPWVLLDSARQGDALALEQLLALDPRVSLLPEINDAGNRRLVRHGVLVPSQAQVVHMSAMNIKALVSHWVLDAGGRITAASRKVFPQGKAGKLKLQDLYELLSGPQRDWGAFRKMMQRMGAVFPVAKLDILSS